MHRDATRSEEGPSECWDGGAVNHWAQNLGRDEQKFRPYDLFGAERTAFPEEYVDYHHMEIVHGSISGGDET